MLFCSNGYEAGSDVRACGLKDVVLQPFDGGDCGFDSRSRAWIFVYCVCCVLYRSGLCEWLIACSEESYRARARARVCVCVCVCVSEREGKRDIETSKTRRLRPDLGSNASAKGKWLWYSSGKLDTGFPPGVFTRFVPDKLALECIIFSEVFFFFPGFILADLMTTHHHQVFAKVITRQHIVKSWVPSF